MNDNFKETMISVLILVLFGYLCADFIHSLEKIVELIIKIVSS